MPAPTKLTKKALIKELETLEKKRIDRQRDFVLPDFRAGDALQFKWVHSLSELRGHTITAICVNRRMRNSLEGSFTCVFKFCGLQTMMKIKQSSPFLRNLKIVAKGSGNLRANLS